MSEIDLGTNVIATATNIAVEKDISTDAPNRVSGKKKPPKRSKTQVRNVQFYQFKQRADKYEEVTSTAIREALALTTPTTQFFTTNNGLVRLHDVTPEGSSDVHLVLWLSREDICSRETMGLENSLGLDDDTRLLEKAHAILFDNSYLAFLVNDRAGHVEQIANYLNEFCDAKLGKVKLRPWISDDTATKIKNTTSINLVQFSLLKQYRAGAAKGLSTIRQTQDAFDDIEYYECEVILKGHNNEKSDFSGTVMQKLNKWLRFVPSSHIFNKLIVRGRNPHGRRQEVNFFKDKLVTQASGFNYEKDGRIKDDSAFEKLTEVYKKLKPELKIAVAFNPKEENLDDDSIDDSNQESSEIEFS